MSFQRRNIKIAASNSLSTESKTGTAKKIGPAARAQGVRQSPLDGRLTTSSGTRSFDSLLAGHGGIPLGTSLLIEEDGTTDFAGALARYYAAEGIVQGHQVHVVGMTEQWSRELPGLSVPSDKKSEKSPASPENKASNDRMKIAWRYERLGEFGNSLSRDRTPGMSNNLSSEDNHTTVFCHDFELGTRLSIPDPNLLKIVPVIPGPGLDFRPASMTRSPLLAFLQHLTSQLATTPSLTIHRVIIPSLLSPAIYPPSAARPEHLLQLLHGLRGLLRKYSSNLTVLLTLPLNLHPRSSGLTRWIEMLADGVLQLTAFPTNSLSPNVSTASTVQEEPPQGILKIHRLPVATEKGLNGEASSGGDDLAFNLSRRKGLVIKPYNLPPLEGDTEAQQGKIDGGSDMPSKKDMEF